VRFTVDSNILVYALDASEADKHAMALDIMTRAPLLDFFLVSQCLAEFLNVVRRKHVASFASAIEQASLWAQTVPVLATDAGHVLKGAAFAARHKMQLFDSIIWQVARSAHATLFLSEDCQDGFEADGMRIVNPFNPTHDATLRALLADSGD
jgi:predicted nucleic acid-binding protein